MRARPERAAQPIFSQPFRQIAAMVCVLVLVALGTYVALPSVMPVVEANPWLNGFIGLVFLCGVLACFLQGFQLIQSVHWIEGFVNDAETHEFSRAPRLLAPLAALLRSRGRAMQLNSTSSRSILDSVATRIEEARDITRYLVNLLIFLGLLGTFYGLATTVPAIVDTIRSLAPVEGEDGMAIFGRLMDGLERQLGGMGVAFGSSLLGLAGSLVVGLLELFASHGQNRFYRELEEWLSSITRIGFAGGETEAAGEQGAAVAVMEHIAGQMDRLQDMFAESDAARAGVDGRLAELTAGLHRLVDRLEGETSLAETMARVADGQAELIDSLREAAGAAGGGLDAESRMRLRSIDVQLLRISEDIASGRHEATAELRADLRQILRALSRGGPPVDLVERRG
ncbi:biopolymer transporter ExbB [Palleronia sediminis]|uniref:Biopolymer transporter ExbB n=1 Tax=Palleronia sediminis TaxID=2547833 RepID=A0A4R6ACW6_9RHOB|nr:biopolymer transporter ExbB [Palleronia sediminis]TDL81851.1 biopolymer transporter ExbB [Palleronia sediminis]